MQLLLRLLADQLFLSYDSVGRGPSAPRAQESGILFCVGKKVKQLNPGISLDLQELCKWRNALKGPLFFFKAPDILLKEETFRVLFECWKLLISSNLRSFSCFSSW